MNLLVSSPQECCIPQEPTFCSATSSWPYPSLPLLTTTNKSFFTFQEVSEITKLTAIGNNVLYPWGLRWATTTPTEAPPVHSFIQHLSCLFCIEHLDPSGLSGLLYSCSFEDVYNAKAQRDLWALLGLMVAMWCVQGHSRQVNSSRPELTSNPMGFPWPLSGLGN